MTRKLIFMTIIIMNAILFSCGVKENVFKKFNLSKTKNDPKEEANYAYYNHDYEKAVSILNAYIKDHPNDYAARASLANAYLASSGLELVDLALDLKKIEKESNGNKEDFFSFLLNKFPENSDKTKRNLTSAIHNFEAIPKKKLYKEQKYYKGLSYIFQSILTLKEHGIKKSKDLTKEALIKLKSDGSLEELINNFNKAKEVSYGTNLGPVSKAIDGISNNIDKQPGDNIVDKIFNYLSRLKKN